MTTNKTPNKEYSIILNYKSTIQRVLSRIKNTIAKNLFEILPLAPILFNDKINAMPIKNVNKMLSFTCG